MNLYDRINEIQGQNAEAKDSMVLSPVMQKAQEQSAQMNALMPTFTVRLTDDEKASVLNLMSVSEDPEKTQAEWEQAILFSREFGLPVEATINSLDELSNYQLGTKANASQTGTQALVNSFRIGELSIEKARLSKEYHDALSKGEDVSAIRSQIQAIDQECQNLQDYTPRQFWFDWMKGAAQSMGYTMRIGGAALAGQLIGDTIIPGAGKYLSTAFAFLKGYNLTTYSQYYDMVENGVDPNVAEWTSIVSGGIQAGIEALLGIETGLGKVLGGGSANFTSKIMKDLYMKGTFNKIALFGSKFLINHASEGLEEFLQQITEEVAENIAYEASGMEMPNSSKKVFKDALESFVQGFGSSLFMGGPLATYVEYKGDMNYAMSMQDEIVKNPSKSDFVAKHMNDEELSTISADKRREALNQTYDSIRSQYETKKAEFNEARIQTIDTNRVEQPVNVGEEDEEGNIVEANTSDELPELKRLENGRLRVQENTNVVQNTDGSERRQLLIGSADNGRRYGTVTYNLNTDGSIDIKSVKTNADYTSITEDAVLELQRRYPGVEMRWEPTSEYQQGIKQKILENSTTGNFNHFSKVSEAQYKAELAEKIGKAFTNLTKAERDVAAELIGYRASAKGMDTNEYMDRFIAEISKNKDLGEGKLGGMERKRLEDGVKAIIYAGENADFSTFVHEFFHTMSMEMGTDERMKLASALKSAKGTDQFRQFVNANRSIIQLSDKAIDEAIDALSDGDLTVNQEELLATLFESYLKEGKTYNTKMQEVFSKIRDFFRRVYEVLRNRILPGGKKGLNEDIIKAYDSLFESERKAEAEVSEREGMLNQSSTESAEYNEVVEKYKGTDQWLKAPNGKATNLTERQWVLTRTPSFIAWFGDWINDPESVSKYALDNNGEPRRFYHGSPVKGITIFKPQRYTNENRSSGFMGSRAHSNTVSFTTEKNMAKGYSVSESDKERILQKWGNAVSDIVFGLVDTINEESEVSRRFLEALTKHDSFAWMDSIEQLPDFNDTYYMSFDPNDEEFMYYGEWIRQWTEDAPEALEEAFPEVAEALRATKDIVRDIDDVSEDPNINGLYEVFLRIPKEVEHLSTSANSIGRDIADNYEYLNVSELPGQTFVADMGLGGTDGNELVVYTDDSYNIKSTDNIGTFDSNNPNIYYQGYDWSRGMSNNAVVAYENGEMPISKWTKEVFLDSFTPEIADILKGIPVTVMRDLFLERTSWHHTSKYFNETNFYSLRDFALDMTEEQARAIADGYERYKSDLKDFRAEKKRILSEGSFTTTIEVNGEQMEYTFTEDEIKDYGSLYGKTYIPSDRISVSEGMKGFFRRGKEKGYSWSQSGNLYVEGEKPTSATPSNGTERILTKDGNATLQRYEDGWKDIESVEGVNTSDLLNDKRGTFVEERLLAEPSLYDYIRGGEGEGILYQEVDISDSFEMLEKGDITETEVEQYIKDLVGNVYDTLTKPLQIQISKDNRKHIIKTNVKLKRENKTRHYASLVELDRIINNSIKTDRDGSLDLSHNSNKKTLKHKSNVVEYVYFETPLKVGNNHFLVELSTERIYGQDPNILDLYNVRVKKNDLAANQLRSSQTKVTNGMVNSNSDIVNTSSQTDSILAQTDNGTRIQNIGGTLILSHSLDENKLLKSIDLGGMPMPSLALSHTDYTSKYGDIILVGSPELAKQLMEEGAVWDRDIWSPMFPRPEYKLNEKGLDRKLRALQENIIDGLEWNKTADLGAWYKSQYESPEELLRRVDDFAHYPALAMAYLKTKGIEIEVPREVPTSKYYSKNTLDKVRKWRNENWQKDINDAWGELYDYIEKDLDADIESVFDKRTRDRIDIKHNDHFGYDRSFDTIYKIIKESKRTSEVKIDYNSLAKAIEEKLDKEGFSKWLREELGQFYSEPMLKIGREWREYNASNMVDYMIKQGRSAGADNALFGTSKSAIATGAAKQLKSRKAMAEQEKYMGQEVYEREDSKIDEIHDRLFGLVEEISKSRKYDNNPYTQMDSVLECIKEYLKKKTVSKNRLASELYSPYNQGEVLDTAFELAEALRNIPREYFEAKPHRLMDLSDFMAALIPDNISEEARKALTDAGLELYGYANRDTALQEYADKKANEGNPILFQAAWDDEYWFTEADETEVELRDEAIDMDRDEFIEYELENIMVDMSEDELGKYWDTIHNVNYSASSESNPMPAIREGMNDVEKDEAFRKFIEDDDNLRAMMGRLKAAFSQALSVSKNGIGASTESEYNEIVSNLRKLDDFFYQVPLGFQNQIKSAKELTEGGMKQLRGFMNKDIRAYRDLYAQFTGDENLKAQAFENIVPDIEKPSNGTTLNIVERRKLANRIEAENLKKKFLSGKETFNGDAEKVIRQMDEDIRNLNKELKKATKAKDKFYNEMNESERKASDLEDQLDEVQRKLAKVNKSISKKIDSSRQIGEDEVQNRNTLQGQVDLLNKQLNALRRSDKVTATAKQKQAIKDLKEQIKAKQKAKAEAEAVRDYKQSLANSITKEVSKAIDYEYGQKIIALQSLIDPNFRRSTLFFDGKKMTVEEFRKYISESYEDFNLSKYQAERLSSKSLDELTVAELEQMAQQIDDLREEGRQIWQAKQDEKRRQSKSIQHQIMREIMGRENFRNPGDEPIPGSAEDKKAQKKASNIARTFWFKSLNMDRKAQMLDGDTKGVAYDLLVRKRREVSANESRAKAKRTEPVAKLMEDLGVKPEDFYRTVTIKLNGKDSTFTISDLYYGIAAQKEQKNYRAFAYGTLVSQEEKRRLQHKNDLIEALGKAKNRQFVEQAQKILASEENKNIVKVFEACEADLQNNAGRLGQVSIEEYNTVPDFQNYYLPIYRADFNGTKLAAEMTDENRRQNPGKNAALPKMGMLKERIDISANNQKPVHLDFFSTWMESVEQTEHLIATLGYERDLKRVFQNFGSESLKSYIDANFGRAMLQDIDNYINEIGNPPIYNDVQGTDKVVRFLRGNLYSAYLGFKASGIVLQAITSPAPTLAYVNPFALTRNLMRMSYAPKKTWSFITSMSEFMKNRSMDPALEVIKEEANNYTDPSLKKKYAKFLEKGTMGLELIDRWAVGASWMALFEKKLSEFESQTDAESIRQAVEYADEIIAETQPLSDPAEIAPLFKGRNEWAKAFMQFTTSMNVIWNNITYDVPKALKNKKFRNGLGMIFGYALAGAILGAVQHGNGDEDEPEEYVRKYLYHMTTQFTGSIPIVGSSIEALANSTITGEPWAYSTQSIFPGIDNTLKGIAKMGEALSADDAEKAKQKLVTGAKTAAKGVGLMAGVPTSALKELSEAFVGDEGFEFKPGAFLGQRD